MINRAVTTFLLLLPSLLFTEVLQAAESFVEGKDYVTISPPVPTSDPNSVEVVELFWYGCPHCYELEPYLQKWRKNRGEEINFVLQPAIFDRDLWKIQAGAFYAAKALGVEEKMHPLIFSAIHKQGRPLSSVNKLAEFFSEHGVTPERFLDNYNSFVVRSQVRRAISLTRRYKINGVPNIVVNGKYRTDGPMARTYDNLLKIVDYLVEKEEKLLAEKQ